MDANAQTLEHFHCPRWAELPDLPLYMDQVVYVLSQIVQPFAEEKERVLTASMINNYVKQQLLPPPEKKRYSTQHVARLIMVNVLKRVLNMGEIAALMNWLSDVYGGQQAYDLFCERLEEMLSAAFGSEKPVVGPVAIQRGAQDALNAALTALVGRLLVQRILQENAPVHPLLPVDTAKEAKTKAKAK